MFVHEGVLREHVRESNRIEGIVATPQTPEYKGHLLAARMAARGIVIDPNLMHAVLGRQIKGFSSFAGRYRTHDLCVGDTQLPRWQHVPTLMRYWHGLVEEFKTFKTLERDVAYMAHLLHVWLLCIHPWEDMNGRNSRLVWNMLRVSRGLSWHIEYARNKRNYYRHIRAIEEQVFKKQNPHVY